MANPSSSFFASFLHSKILLNRRNLKNCILNMSDFLNRSISKLGSGPIMIGPVKRYLLKMLKMNHSLTLVSFLMINFILE